MDRLVVEASGEKVLEPCPDCGNTTRNIWGFIAKQTGDVTAAYAVYYMRWTDTRPDHGVVIVLSIGGWGDSKRHKVCIGLEAVIDATGSSYRFVDASQTPWAEKPELGEMLEAWELMRGPLGAEALGIVGALEQSDPRFRQFIGGTSS